MIQDDEVNAEKTELKRQLGIVFSKLEALHYDVRLENNQQGLSVASGMKAFQKVWIPFETILKTILKQMDGMKMEVERVKEDLGFMKKGYSGIFDIVSNAADSQQCKSSI